MTQQPEALRLAELIDWPSVKYGNEAAAELRKLHDRITTLEAALRQSLEALEFYYNQHGEESDARVIAALRERLAQPEQERCDVLRLAQDALQMAIAPFPVDEVKTLRALQAVNKLLKEMEQS